MRRPQGGRVGTGALGAPALAQAAVVRKIAAACLKLRVLTGAGAPTDPPRSRAAAAGET